MGNVTRSGVASWGVTAEGNPGVNGIVTHSDLDKESVLAPEYNEIGQVVKQTLYDLHKTITMTVEVAAGEEPPDEKSSITYAGVTAYVVRARVVEDNRAYRHIEITIEAYANCTAVTVAEGSGL